MSARAGNLRRLHGLDVFKQVRGDLTYSERQSVIAAVTGGADREWVAAQWLISRGRLDHIISEHRRGVNSRGLPVEAAERPDHVPTDKPPPAQALDNSRE